MEQLLALPTETQEALRQVHMHQFSRIEPAPALPPLAAPCLPVPSLGLCTINMDSFAVGVALARAELRPAVLNMANEYNCGGAWCDSAGSQEEDLFRASSLPLCLWPLRRGSDNRLAKFNSRLPRTTAAYPWRAEATVLYSPSVLVTRQDDGEAPPTVAVLSAAAQDLRDYKPHYAGPFDESITRQKARAVLWAAASHGHDVIVLGAFGCGAFCNPSERMASIFAELLDPTRGEFGGRFRVVAFAIIKSRHLLETFGARFPIVNNLAGCLADYRSTGAHEMEID